MKKSFKIVTLGCRTNQYESQLLREQLLNKGYCENRSCPETIIFNTCCVTESAERKAKQILKAMLKDHPDAKIFLTGCFAQEESLKLKRFYPQVSVISNLQKQNLADLIIGETQKKVETISYFEGHTRAFVKIQDGCRQYCSYCIIPKMRGTPSSRSLSTIRKEISDLVMRGYQEIVLTGINIGAYRTEENIRLSDLIQEIDSIQGLKRLRLSSLDPFHVDEKLLKILLQTRTICEHLHFVLQSGSNRILQLMNRHYTFEQYKEIIDRFLVVQPLFCFSTDIIVGFPSESEEDFEKTLEAVRISRFIKVHVFPFSKRPDTKAAMFPQQLPSQTIHARIKRMHEEVEMIAKKRRSDFIGKTLQVLLERVEKDRVMGYSSSFIKVYGRGHQPKRNTIVTIKIEDNCKDGLIGTII